MRRRSLQGWRKPSSISPLRVLRQCRASRPSPRVLLILAEVPTGLDEIFELGGRAGRNQRLARFRVAGAARRRCGLTAPFAWTPVVLARDSANVLFTCVKASVWSRDVAVERDRAPARCPAVGDTPVGRVLGSQCPVIGL